MFTQSEYLLAWLFYLIGVLCCGVCWWMLTAKIRFSELRAMMRAFMFALLLTPWYTQGTGGGLSPAVVMMFIEGLFESGGTFSRAGMPLLTSCSVVLIVLLVFYVVKRLIGQKVKISS